MICRLIVDKTRPFGAHSLLDRAVWDVSPALTAEKESPTLTTEKESPTLRAQSEADHSLTTLCQFLQSAFHLTLPIECRHLSPLTPSLTTLSPVQNQAAMLLTEAMRVLDVLHAAQFVRFARYPHSQLHSAPLDFISADHRQLLANTPFIDFVASPRLVSELAHVLQEALVPAYVRPWDGADGFEALCERLAERCGGYFSAVEKLVQEAAFLLHLRGLSANEADFAAEKLELAIASCLREELPVTRQRVEALLAQRPVVLVRVLLRGSKLLQTMRMMAVEDTCVESGRSALAAEQAALEEAVMTALETNRESGSLKEMCDVVCVEGSMALKKRVLRWLVDCGQRAVVLQLDEAAAELFLRGGDYALLHDVYVAHGHLMKAATLLFEVCVMCVVPSERDMTTTESVATGVTDAMTATETVAMTTNTPLTLQERHEGLAMCLRDLEDLERSGSLERAPYAEMAAPRLRALLKTVELQQQMHGVKAVEAIEPVEAVQEECVRQRRFDLALECLVLRGDSTAESVCACWENYISERAGTLGCAEAVVASVVALMKTVKEPAFLPLQTILSCLMQLGLPRESQVALLVGVAEAGVRSVEVPTLLLGLLDATAEERGRVAVGALIETWVKGLSAEERASEAVRYLVEMTCARLASVVELREEAERVCSGLLELWRVCWNCNAFDRLVA